MSWDWEKLQEKRRNQDKSARKSNQPEDPFPPKKGGTFLGKDLAKAPPLWLLFVTLILIWLGFGLFIVGPGEVGVVTRCGRFDRIVAEGPNFCLPYPFETVTMVSAKELNLDLGRAARRPGDLDQAVRTADQGLVFVRCRVRYRIASPQDYLFQAKNPEAALEYAAETAMRAAVGRRTIDQLLTTDHTRIQDEILRDVRAGSKDSFFGLEATSVQIVSVDPPLEAEADYKALGEALTRRVVLLQEAAAYGEQTLPELRGKGAEALRAAEARSRNMVRQAEAEAERFAILAAEYKKNPAGFMHALCLVSMQEILTDPNIAKTLVPAGAAAHPQSAPAQKPPQGASPSAKPQPAGKPAAAGTSEGK